MNKSWYLGLGVGMIALLTGCGGGGGSSSGGGGGGGGSTTGPASPGLYWGVITQSNNPGDSQLILSVTTDGSANFVNQAPNTYAKGTLNFSGGNVEGSIHQFQLGRPISEGQLVGESTTNSFEGTSYRETSDGDLVEESTFRFDRVGQLSDIAADLGKIDGSWTDTLATSPTTSITIGSDGILSGGDSNCNFNGTVTIPDRSINIYRLDFTASNCQGSDRFTAEEQSGDYLGYSYYAPASGDDPEKLVFLADNDKMNRYFVFER